LARKDESARCLHAEFAGGQICSGRNHRAPGAKADAFDQANGAAPQAEARSTAKSLLPAVHNADKTPVYK
jgi:hypothetical protein